MNVVIYGHAHLLTNNTNTNINISTKTTTSRIDREIPVQETKKNTDAHFNCTVHHAVERPRSTQRSDHTIQTTVIEFKYPQKKNSA